MFFDRIRDLENRLQRVELDAPSVTTFVLQLPDEHLRTLLESMTRQRTSKRWADAFTRAYGCWAEVLRALSRRWNAALHAETCRANIPQDWTLALPLVRDAVGRRAFDEAAKFIGEAVRSRLRLAEGERWDPRRELLVRRERFYCSEGERNRLARLLRLWHQTAEGLRQVDLAAALTLHGGRRGGRLRGRARLPCRGACHPHESSIRVGGQGEVRRLPRLAGPRSRPEPPVRARRTDAGP